MLRLRAQPTEPPSTSASLSHRARLGVPGSCTRCGRRPLSQRGFPANASALTGWASLDARPQLPGPPAALSCPPPYSSTLAFSHFISPNRADCSTNLGCNEAMHAALCCAAISSCGNGIVDDDREECDDGNDDDFDDCSNACANKRGAGPF